MKQIFDRAQACEIVFHLAFALQFSLHSFAVRLSVVSFHFSLFLLPFCSFYCFFFSHSPFVRIRAVIAQNERRKNKPYAIYRRNNVYPSRDFSFQFFSARRIETKFNWMWDCERPQSRTRAHAYRCICMNCANDFDSYVETNKVDCGSFSFAWNWRMGCELNRLQATKCKAKQ